MIGAVCAYMGIMRSNEMKNRCVMLERLISAFEMLETEIRFNRTEIKKAFLNTEKALPMYGFLKTAAENMDKLGIKKAWENAADKCLRSLSDVDRNAVKILSSKLGMTDAEGQIKQLEYVKNILKHQAGEAEKEYKRLGRLYRSGGVLAGAFIVLVLL